MVFFYEVKNFVKFLLFMLYVNIDILSTKQFHKFTGSSKVLDVGKEITYISLHVF